MSLTIPIETSARHIHITEEDFEILFGPGAKPTFAKELSQPGQYACKERPLPERDAGRNLCDRRQTSGHQKCHPSVRRPGGDTRLHADRSKGEDRTVKRRDRRKTAYPYDPRRCTAGTCQGQ